MRRRPGDACQGLRWALAMLAMAWGSHQARAAESSPRTDEQVIEKLSRLVARSKALESLQTPYDVAFRRDPMQAMVDEQGRLVSSVGLQGGMSIQGVIWSEERPLAVVDGELAATGSVIGPYRIVRIRQDGVVVQRRDQAQTVWIPLDHGAGPTAE